MSYNPHFSYHANAGGSAQRSSDGAAVILVSADRPCFHRKPLMLFITNLPRAEEAREGGCKVWHELFFGLPRTRKRSGALID